MTKTKEAKIPIITLTQVNADVISQLASKYWSNETSESHLPFDSSIIEEIYKNEITDKHLVKRVMMLEFSQYLENYLWPNYEVGSTSKAHIMSIVIMVNEKFRERVQVWHIFENDQKKFSNLFRQVMQIALEDEFHSETHIKELTAITMFIDHCFNSMEVSLCREQVKKLVSLSMWNCLQSRRREYELQNIPEWKKFWKKLQKKGFTEESIFDNNFLQHYMIKFIKILETITIDKPINANLVNYCERFIEFIIDLEALLPTRRFFNTVLDDCHLLVRCKLSNLAKREEGKLFRKLLDMAKFYARFEINDVTGDPLTDHDMTQLHYSKITSLQRAAFIKFPDLKIFTIKNVANVDSHEILQKHFSALDQENLRNIASFLKLVPNTTEKQLEWHRLDKEFLVELLVSRHERRVSQLESLNKMPLYPTEDIIWDENIVPTEFYSGEGCFALPKLNLQFLTLHDYLLRNFNLFRLESTYEIRQDIEDAVSRMLPWKSEDNDIVFGGWARMALPISLFEISEVAKPRIGDRKPSKVRADVTVTLSVRKEVKEEWENLKRHDVCFLITVDPIMPYGTKYNPREPFIPQVGLVNVRGCEIEGMLDANGRIIEEGPDLKPNLVGEQRTYRVWLDPNQYQADMESLDDGRPNVYDGFNIIMRRKPKENNFKAVLETIRDLMNSECVVPLWLHDILLGYGDPSSAHYTNMDLKDSFLDFNDTFLDIDHLKNSFPDCNFDFKGNENDMKPPFRLTFADETKTILAESYVIKSRGPYEENTPKRNSIYFTPTQIEAIKSGMQPGLTLIVGPPGTGKTDVAVQIISNIYHNHPNQRTLIVTHSNQALNQLFEKIMALDIDERHLLRLGHGEEALETEKDFSRYGRVNYVLAKRIELLRDVQKLQESLNLSGDSSYTCETAGYFFLYQIVSRWEKFLTKINSCKNSHTEWKTMFEQEFPFKNFFADVKQPLFSDNSFENNMRIAESCYYYISHIFAELEEFRAFELLRNGLDRSKYLLVKEAKIIAMTCTHAALKRKELVSLGFKYDNILMEESAQILEIETFIPLLLQNTFDGYNRLKRWIMIGDHHQLPPIIKNMAFQKYSNMEQSLFTRLVRLNVPTINLDSQGRCRPSISCLYKWKYNKLNDLDHVISREEYKTANPGFAFEYQFINVGEFNGVGESEPNPFFYQNLAEAEYIVAVYMYMRILGYPAEKISILTTYNGQKHLIRDVINLRCAQNSLIGWPSKVTTVDKYQGQQNDYILISLVRTKAVGHLRDVRRLVVAMSRSKLGLYIFGNLALFQNCPELQHTFKILTKRPQDLHLVEEEFYPTSRLIQEEPSQRIIIKNMSHMVKYINHLYMAKVDSLQNEIELIQQEKVKEEYLQNEKKSETKTSEAFDETKLDGKQAQNTINLHKVTPIISEIPEVSSPIENLVDEQENEEVMQTDTTVEQDRMFEKPALDGNYIEEEMQTSEEKINKANTVDENSEGTCAAEGENSFQNDDKNTFQDNNSCEVIDEEMSQKDSLAETNTKDLVNDENVHE
ncbi:RNA helicase aquarius [Condylostylus longicornis]|uniref:RNA helicase aquarius n=1 Tax=Condylostylus longicornis TaxID=2530218 RepID=UPI00244D9BB8|nr:RNA helicase aquarius [Condylostylus longicornis]